MGSMNATMLLEGNEERISRLPFDIPVLVLSILGVIGNSIVIHVFRKYYVEDSTYRIFVFFLSFCDLSICIAHIAKEFEKIYFVMQTTKFVEVCKISNFLGFVVGASSFYVIFVIAVERYRRICHPFGKQISVSSAKWFCLLSVIISIVLAVPILFIFGFQIYTVDGRITTRCSIQDDRLTTYLPVVYFIGYAIFSVILCISITILQGKTIRNIIKQHKVRSMLTNKNTLKVANPDLSNDKNTSAKNQSESTEIKTTEQHQSVRQKSQRRQRLSVDKKHIKIAVMFSIISFLLIVSYTSRHTFYLITLYELSEVRNKVVSRSLDIVMLYVPDVVIINGVINPFVYFFNDPRFRASVFEIFKRK